MKTIFCISDCKIGNETFTRGAYMSREYAKFLRTGKEYNIAKFYFIIEKLTDKEALNTMRHLELKNLSDHFITINIY